VKERKKKERKKEEKRAKAIEDTHHSSAVHPESQSHWGKT